MAKIKRSVSAILSVLMAGSVLTTAPVSAATVEASDADVNTAATQQAELKIAEGSCGEKLTWSLSSDGVLEISGEGKMYDFDFEAKEGESSFDPWTLYHDQIKKVVVKDGVEYVGNFAFFGFAELEDVEMPENIILGENVFEGCEKLDKTTIPEASTEAVADVKAVEETTKKSPIIVKEEESAVGASVSISKCTITLSTTSCTYSYCERKPIVTVKNGSKTLVNGTDYKLTYKNNINPGTATVTVTGKGGYTGSVEKKFTVNKRDISTTNITLSSNDYTYSGNPKKPTVTATYNSKTLVKDTDYTVSYSNNTYVGTATVTITGTGKYFTGTVTKSFSIHRKSISDFTATVDCPDNEYDGKLKSYTITVKDGSKILEQDVDYSCSVNGSPIGMQIGKIGISITGKGNYKGTTKAYVEIKPRSINKAIGFTSKKSFVLDDSNKVRHIVYLKDDISGSLAEVDRSNYKVTYVDQPNGSVDAIVEGQGKYSGTKTISYRPDEIPENAFVWGRDNWSFDNTGYYFPYKYTVNDRVMAVMANELCIDEWDYEYLVHDNENNNNIWGGSCYGMAVTSILASEGYLNPTVYFGDAVPNTYTPVNGSEQDNVISAINFIQILQNDYHYTHLLRIYDNHTPQECFSKAEEFFDNCNDNNSLIQLSYCGTWGAHAVVAYGYEKYNYYSESTGRTYSKRLLIYDSNYGSKNIVYRESCIYYNDDGSWICPYRNTNESNGAIQSMILHTSVTDTYDILSGRTWIYNSDRGFYEMSFNGYLTAINDSYSAEKDFVNDTYDLCINCYTAENEALFGDIDLDGEVNITDVTLLSNYLAELATLDDAQLYAADVDHDGDVSIADVMYLQFYLAEFV